MDQGKVCVENPISVDMDCSSGGDHGEGELCVPVDSRKAVDDEIYPHIGILFDTLKDACNYYNEYARREGFSVRKRRANKKQGDSSKVVLCCSREGYSTVVNTREEKRCGCLARFEIQVDHEEKFFLSKFVAEHTHELVPPSVHTSNKGFSCSYYDPWKVPSHFDEESAARFRELRDMIHKLIEAALQSDDLYDLVMSKFVEMKERLDVLENSKEPGTRDAVLDSNEDDTFETLN